MRQLFLFLSSERIATFGAVYFINPLFICLNAFTQKQAPFCLLYLKWSF